MKKKPQRKRGRAIVPHTKIMDGKIFNSYVKLDRMPSSGMSNSNISNIDNNNLQETGCADPSDPFSFSPYIKEECSISDEEGGSVASEERADPKDWNEESRYDVLYPTGDDVIKCEPQENSANEGVSMDLVDDVQGGVCYEQHMEGNMLVLSLMPGQGSSEGLGSVMLTVEQRRTQGLSKPLVVTVPDAADIDPSTLPTTNLSSPQFLTLGEGESLLLSEVTLLADKPNNTCLEISDPSGNSVSLQKTGPVGCEGKRTNEIPREEFKSRSYYCLFCKKNVTNFSRHLEKYHHNEFIVKKYSKIPTKNSEEMKTKRLIFKCLRNTGDYLNENSVVESKEARYHGKSTMKPVRRLSKSKVRSYNSYATCKACFGLYSKKNFYKHRKSCIMKSENPNGQVLRSYLSQFTESGEMNWEKKVVSSIEMDEIGMIALKDPLLVSTVKRCFTSNLQSPSTVCGAVSKLRAGGRLLLSLQQKDERVKCLSDVFEISNIDVVVKCVEELSGYNCTTQTLRHKEVLPTLLWILKFGSDEFMSSGQSMSTDKSSKKHKKGDFNNLLKKSCEVFSKGTEENKKDLISKILSESMQTCKAQVEALNPPEQERNSLLASRKIATNSGSMEKERGGGFVAEREVEFSIKDPPSKTVESNSLSSPMQWEEFPQHPASAELFTDKARVNADTVAQDTARSYSRKPKRICKAMKHCCFYCKKFVTKMSRHLQTVHKYDLKCDKYLEKELKDKAKKKEIFNNIRLKGDFIYNSWLLKNTSLNGGKLNSEVNSFITSKKIKILSKTMYDYVTCKKCCGLFLRKGFSLHARKCFKGVIDFPSKPGKINFIKTCGEPLANKTKPRKLRKKRTPILTLNDSLIMSTVTDFYGSNLSPIVSKYMVPKKLRDGIKLLQKIQEKDKEVKCLTDIFDPAKVDTVVRSVEELSGYNSSTDTFEVFGMSARLSWILTECSAKLLLIIENEETSTYEEKNTRKHKVMEFINILKEKCKFIFINLDKGGKKEDYFQNNKSLQLVSTDTKNQQKKSDENVCSTVDEITPDTTIATNNSASDKIKTAAVEGHHANQAIKPCDSAKDLAAEDQSGVDSLLSIAYSLVGQSMTTESEEVQTKERRTEEEHLSSKTEFLHIPEASEHDEPMVLDTKSKKTKECNNDQSNATYTELLVDQSTPSESKEAQTKEDDSGDKSLSSETKVLHMLEASEKDESLVLEIDNKKTTECDDNKSNAGEQTPHYQLDLQETLNADTAIINENKKNEQKHYCMYCKGIFSNFTSHLLKNHENELPVQQYREITGKSRADRKRRTQIVDSIRREGDFNYIKLVLSGKQSDAESSSSSVDSVLLPLLKSGTKNSKYDYVVCKKCKGVFVKRTFFVHAKKCIGVLNENVTSPDNKVIKTKKRYLTKYSEPLYEDQLQTVEKDPQKIPISDTLLVSTVRDYYGPINKSKKSKYMTPKKLRDGVKLLEKVQEKDESVKCLTDIFDPSKAETVVRCVEEICDYDISSNTTQAFGMSTRLSWILTECSAKRLRNIKSGKSSTIEEKEYQKHSVLEFIQLLTNKCKFLSVDVETILSKEEEDPDSEISPQPVLESVCQKEESEDICTANTREMGSAGKKRCCSDEQKLNGSRVPKKRKRWTEDEKRIVINHFENFIKRNARPGYRLCQNLIDQDPLLSGRTPIQMNIYIDNLVRGKVELPSEFEHLKSFLKENIDK